MHNKMVNTMEPKVTDKVVVAGEWHKVSEQDGYWYTADGRGFKDKRDAEASQFLTDLDN